MVNSLLEELILAPTVDVFIDKSTEQKIYNIVVIDTGECKVNAISQGAQVKILNMITTHSNFYFNGTLVASACIL